MATSQLSRVIEEFRQATLARDGAGKTDGQLLEAFVSRQDEAAFTALVHLHGPMVLGVCRRLLGNVHDSEEAFQATFLVLARKAASIRPREMVGNWLYGVASRTALGARAANARRRSRERQVDRMPEPQTDPEDLWLELQPLLDQELSRLPDRYRVPVVLCELEGRTRRDVARQLAIPEGTLSSRLATARKLLAGRLSRRGLTLSGGLLGAVLSENVASAVPASLVTSTVKGATLVAAGETGAAGLVSARVAALAKGVIQGMFVSKLKIATVVLLTLALGGTGAVVLTHKALAGNTGDEKVARPRDGDKPRDPNRVRDGDKPRDPRAPRDGDKPRDPKAPRDGEKPRDPKAPRDGDKPRDPNRPRDGDRPREGNPNKGRGGEAVTLTGTVSKQQMKRMRDDGSEFTLTRYYLTEAKGNKVLLPGPRVSEAGKLLDKFNLPDFVGKKVTVTGRAFTARTGDAPNAPRRVVRVIVITDIKETK
jgi:RNA polymerase sigma factor (sigma-70 family)